jgi:zinc D-Ala-D-Ala carboxypeptidase
VGDPALATEDLSEHLSVAEWLSTQQRDCLDEQWRIWRGTPQLWAESRRFAVLVFELVRAEVGVPLHINSGYRCPTLNNRVGGVPTSRHQFGLAADVVPVGLSLDLAMRRISSGLRAGRLRQLDKAIIECGSWIHIQGSHAGVPPRGLALATDDTTTFRLYDGEAA